MSHGMTKAKGPLWPVLCAALGLFVLSAVAGCGKKAQAATSAQEAVELFLQRLSAQDYEGAADLIAWPAMAAVSNPDWHSFPPSQRKLIIDRVRSESMSDLQALSDEVAKGAAELRPQPTESPDMFLVQTAGQPLFIRTVQTQDGWQVLLPGWSF